MFSAWAVKIMFAKFYGPASTGPAKRSSLTIMGQEKESMLSELGLLQLNSKP